MRFRVLAQATYSGESLARSSAVRWITIGHPPFGVPPPGAGSKMPPAPPLLRDPYLRQTFPIELDEAITRLVEAFRQVDIGYRSGSAKDLPVEVGDSHFLLTYAVRMATHALRKASPDRIKDGLAAVLLEGERDDWRENVIVLSLLNDAAKKIG